MLLLTDLEALHPAVRIGTIENQLTQSFKGPVIVFYPGQRTANMPSSFWAFIPKTATTAPPISRPPPNEYS
ncbi:hypothetical protein ACFQT0_28535 [Hymenobacter humi]|uniref:Transposase n=1 Tax=Hymenobacter humi TaxID=1411620 RepID=A0ABW2UEP9_9BACT